ncbi:AAA family ATPase [Mesorhizobium sp. LjNodule214]|uniref:AAA family ATPase n=1 Tax=Mesorhizobium sp. LjNodule214 TaxID=3342252 RepID=UPI003ECCD075
MTTDDLHIARSAVEWRKEQARRIKPQAHTPPRGADPPNPLPTTVAATLAAHEPPARQFLDSACLLPARNVVLLSGDGGTGKSLLALQLALAVSTASKWIGIEVSSGPVLYLSAEEDQDETHARLAEICAAEGMELGEAYTLNIAFMAGEDAVLAFEDKGTRLTTTPLYRSLAATLEAIEPALLILDNLADVFSGNENSRTLAKHFVGILRRLAIRHDCVVLLLGHPSLSGLHSGSGSSGSTAWSNSVRARLYLHKDSDGSGFEADQTRRLLETKKANYGPSGLPIGLRWERGRFVRSDPPKPFDAVSLADLEKVQAAFAAGRYRANDQATDWGGYVVASILDLDVGRGMGSKERSAEQNRARANVKQVLATWVRNKALFIVRGFDAKREPTTFFSVKEGDDGLV